LHNIAAAAAAAGARETDGRLLMLAEPVRAGISLVRRLASRESNSRRRRRWCGREIFDSCGLGMSRVGVV